MKRNISSKLSLAILASIFTVSSFTLKAQSTSLAVSETVTNPTCFGYLDGAITLSINGGALPYNIIWSTGDTTASIQNLAPGLYSVTIGDNNGNEINNQYYIASPVPVQISGTVTSSSANGALDGAIDATITGGVGAYNFVWHTNYGIGLIPTAIDQINISNGTYFLTAEDINGCKVTKQFYLATPSLVAVAPVPVSALSGALVGEESAVDLMYPNPSQGNVTLSSLKEMDRIEVYSSIGILVNEFKNFNGLIKDEQLTLSPGNYNVVFIHSDGTKNAEKLIVR